MKITFLKPAHEKEVLELIQECFPYTKFTEKYIKNTKDHIFTTVEGSELLGFLDFTINKKQFWIYGVVTKPKFRRKGIASKLLFHTLNYAKEQGFKEIKLLVWPENKPALKLYRKFGFKKIEENKNMFPDKVIWVMRKTYD